MPQASTNLAWLILLSIAGCASVQPAPAMPESIVGYKQVLRANPQVYAAILPRVYPVIADYDSRTNTIICRGSPDSVAASIALMNQLDSPVDDDTGLLYGPILFIKHLHHANARDLVPILEEMTRKGGFDEPHETLFKRPLFVADERTNALLIKADRINEERIRRTIDELDSVPDAR